MCKGILSLMLLVTLCVGGNVFAVEYTSSGEIGLWNDVATWGGGGYPLKDDDVHVNGASIVTIDGTAEECIGIAVGSYSPGEEAHLDIINGGSLVTTTEWVWLGNRAEDLGIVTVGEGSSFIAGDPFNVGYYGDGIVIVDGGTVEANGGLYVPNPWAGSGVSDGTGLIDLRRGTVYASELAMAPGDGIIDISAGTLILNGDWTGDIDPQVIAYGGSGTLDIQFVGGNTVVKAIHQYVPNPKNGGTAGAGSYEMTWVLPDPNHPSGVVSCDVYVSDTFEGESVSLGDPNFPDYASKEVNGLSVGSVTVTLESLKNYYWRIDIHDTSADEPIIGPIFTFDTMNAAPVVNLGADVPTWLVDGTAEVNLTGVVGHDDLPGPGYTVAWEVVSEPAAGAAEITLDVDPLKISVSFTELGDYELKLTADDSVLEGSDTVMISVYSDNCEAAKESGVALLEGDINADCVVDMADVAAMAVNWLESMAL